MKGIVSKKKEREGGVERCRPFDLEEPKSWIGETLFLDIVIYSALCKSLRIIEEYVLAYDY
jgi:hypothetical protein